MNSATFSRNENIQIWAKTTGEGAKKDHIDRGSIIIGSGMAQLESGIRGYGKAIRCK